MYGQGDWKEEEASEVAWEAGKGAIAGASKWGMYAAALGATAYALSPIYRGLTIQFKVYLQMSGMIFGGMTEADRRARQYIRLRRKAEIRRAIERETRNINEAPNAKNER